MTNDPDDLAFDVQFEEDYEMNLKRTLKIKTSYINHSNKKLEKVKSHRRKSLSKNVDTTLKNNVQGNRKVDRKITYVGVHNRRTDHIRFMRERENREPLDESYFAFAFQFFRYISSLTDTFLSYTYIIFHFFLFLSFRYMIEIHQLP